MLEDGWSSTETTIFIAQRGLMDETTVNCNYLMESSLKETTEELNSTY